MKPRPFRHWRMQADDRSGARTEWHSDGALEFDEFVLDGVLHIEALDRAVWFVEVAGLRLWVSVGRDGKARITNEERDT